MGHREQGGARETWTLAAALSSWVTAGWVIVGCGGGAAGDVSLDVGEARRASTVEARIRESADDAEELVGGTVSLSSPQLELVGLEPGTVSARANHMVGLRFAQLAVPQGATVTQATLAFTVDEVSLGAASVYVRAEAADDAAPFTEAPGDVSTRSLTATQVAWEPGEWLEVGEEQRSAELAPLLQEVVDRPGWSEGGALALLVSGQGQRTARAFDAVPAAAPRLSVSFAVLAGSCAPGQLRCTGSVLERCNGSATDFQLLAIFVNPQLCQEALSTSGVRSNGQACSSSAQCASRNCVDGVCCDCGQGGRCDAQGVCLGPSVQCGTQTCSGGNACCSRLDIATGVRSLACGVGNTCNFPGGGAGPIVRVACDQHADCANNQVCCLVTNNVNSGELSCRQTCTAQAVAAELGAPPAALVVGQICASPAGQLFLSCPSGQSCSTAVSTLPTQYSICR